jgi:protocatechuate 3,4-dioxygenase beta subunit
MPRSLPPNPDLTQLKNRAKTLLRAHRDSDAGVCQVLRALPRFVQSDDAAILAADVALHDVQHALSLYYGYRSWTAMKEHILALGATTGIASEDDDATKDTDGTTRPQKETCHGERPRGDCSIDGKVIADGTGQPVAHARVYLFYLGTHAAMFIDVAGDGSFCFADIPAGNYSLQTTHTQGYQDAAYNPEDAPGQFPQFSLKSGEKRDGVVLIAQPAFSIAGAVLDETGKPLRDAHGFHVLAWVRGGRGIGEWQTAAKSTVNASDGSYSLDGLDGRPVHLMAIDWEAWRKDNTFPPRYFPGTFSRDDATSVVFDDTRHHRGIDIRLARHGGLVLEGTVTEEATGEPVPDAFVVVHREDMLFDFVAAYTDPNGRYVIDGLGEGQFLLHVDAVHRGLIRTREPVRIRGESIRVDVTLRQGGTVTGRLVDENGDEWHADNSYGHAHVEGHPQPGSSFSLTGFRNRHRPADALGGSGGGFLPGKGDYGSGEMIFPTPMTFILQGLAPGQTTIRFEPKREGHAVKQILHQGQDVREAGLRTQPGQPIDDITIVIGATDG